MKILLAMRSMAQSEGGPITAALGLAHALIARGHEVTITAHDDGHGGSYRYPDSLAEVIIFPRTRPQWEHSRQYAKWLSEHVAHYDFVIINSLWISHVHYAARACAELGVPYVIRPHGCLNKNDMAHHKWRKLAYWALEERANCKRAVAVHCTSDQEVADARGLGVHNAVNIPLGVDSSLFDLPPSNRDRTAVIIVGRIAEKKGIDVLLRALSDPRCRAMGMRLDVVGVDHRGLQSGLMALADDLGLQGSVTFHGHADPVDRNRHLAKAGIFALPSKDENFGIAVAEAMAAGIPPIISPHVSHAPLVARTTSGLVAERSPSHFADALVQLGTMPTHEYEAMCNRARDVVRTNFSWERTAARLELLARPNPELHA